MEKQSISRNIQKHWYFPHVLFEYAKGMYLGSELKRVQTRVLALLEDFCFISPLFSSFCFTYTIDLKLREITSRRGNLIR